MTDERESKPSASGYESYQFCPGKWNAERGIPEPEHSADADSGTRIHDALADQFATDKLTDDEFETFDKCNAATARLTGLLESTAMEVYRERRLWYFQGLQRIFSGKADFIAIAGRKALIIDYKTGRAEVAESASNPQLRALAVLVAQEFDVESVMVAIVQPWVSGEQQVCEYNALELAIAETELRETLEAILYKDAVRIPGEKQCRYCRAKMSCPEAQASVAIVQTIAPSLPTLTGPQLSDFLAACGLAEDVIAAAKSEARKRLGDDPAAVPGWQLSPGAERRTVTDVQTIFSRLAPKGVTMEQFTAICGIAIGDLEKITRKATNTKGAALKAEVDAILEGCVEVKTTAKKLEHSK